MVSVVRFNPKGDRADTCASLLESLAESIRRGDTSPDSMVIVWEQDGDPTISFHCDTLTGVGLCQYASTYLMETDE